MLSVLETLLDILLVVGTSIWGWLGLVAGLCGDFLVWHVLESTSARAPVAAFAFIIIFMAIYWQEFRKK